MIRISIRKNLIYLLLLFISYTLRRIVIILLDKIFGLDNSLIFSFLMVLGEIIGGIIIYLYQCNFNKKTKSGKSKFSIELIQNNREMKKADKGLKIIFLLFLASFFDLEEYLIITNFIPEIAELSTTTTLRLCSIMTITSSIICIITLIYKIARHRIFVLIILGIFSGIIIILDFIFKPKNIYFWKYVISYLLVLCHFIFLSFTDVIEKYLAEYDYLDTFQMILSEGIFSFIMISIYSIFQNPLKEVSVVYNEISTGQFVLLIILLILYAVFSAGVNIYRIFCNILYSPMTKSLASYFFISPFIIYQFIDGNDFIYEGERNYVYFFLNLIICIIIDFLGLVYNEFFILNFWNLSKETHSEISRRATKVEGELVKGKKIEMSDKDENDNDSEGSDDDD
jgi:hypothetical protein